MKNFGLRLRLRNGEAQGGGASINAGKNPLKRRLRYAVLSKIAILFLLLLVGVGNAWGAATAIPNNTIIYVDVANFNDVSHTVNNATDDKYYVSKPNYYNVTENRYTTASYTGGAGSYWPAGDSTWVQLTKISGNLFAFKTSNKWFDGKLSFWTKNQNNYGNVYEACVALLQEYDGAKNLFTLTKTKTYHSDRHASCFGTSKSAINLMKGGETLYLKANSNWKADGARFAAVFLGQSGQQWVSFTQVGSTDYYKCTIPTTGSGEWPYVIICRMNGANQTNSWDNRWNQTEDFAAPSGTENCIALPSTITTGCSWHKYTEGYAIVGEMNDWKPMANTMSGASTTKSVTMTLAAKKSYAFKVAEGFDDGWWGYDSSTDYKLTFAGQNTEYALLQTTGHDILMFTTATSGEYTFTWNTSTHKLSITYPTVTHPCSDYIYFYNDQSWNPVAIHAWNGTCKW